MLPPELEQWSRALEALHLKQQQKHQHKHRLFFDTSTRTAAHFDQLDQRNDRIAALLLDDTSTRHQRLLI